MSDLKTLRASCKALVERRQRGLTLELSCVVCRQRVRGEGCIMQHYADAHGVQLTAADNIADMDGFFSHLRMLMFPCGDGEMRCPVCGNDCDGEAALGAHVAQEGHGRWDACTVPALAPFCIATLNMKKHVGEEADDDDEDEEEENTANGKNALPDDEDDEDEDWDVEDAVCLLCDTSSEDVLTHMAEVHSFDFVAAVRSHEGIRDMYDTIRVVNIIRKCVARGVCPFHYGSEAAGEKDGEVEACCSNIAASSLQEHLKKNPLHALPRVVPSSDRELIPVLCGDAFISSVVVGGDFFPQEEEEPDYPMVPTLVEMAKKHAASKQQKSGEQNT